MANIVRCLNEAAGERWHAYHGDCIDVASQLPDNSIDFSVFSPPFAGLYIYNDSVADCGNCASDAEFMEHYQFLADQLFRIMRPGRIVAVHCKDLVFYRNQRGTAGLRDFPGMLIRAHEQSGFTFHSRVTIWRDPVREMTKTKAHGLLYKQLRADSSFSRQGLPEYFCIFRKWPQRRKEDGTFEWLEGDVDDVLPVTHTKATFPLPQWQEWASPVWMTTRETDVLHSKRDHQDEKHICPMPLDLTQRATLLWSNPGEVVLSPFMGIGSEGDVALRHNRRFIGVELKESYFRTAVRNLTAAEANAPRLFSDTLAAD